MKLPKQSWTLILLKPLAISECTNISQELNIAYHRIKSTFQDKHTEDAEHITELAFKPGKA